MSEHKAGRAKVATILAVRARDAANKNALKAIDMVLSTLAEVIGEERLRGLPNLATSSHPYRAIQVLAVNRSGSTLRYRRPVLCLNARAKLVLATFKRNKTVSEVGVSEIRAEWAEDVTESAIQAIDCHLGACEKSEKKYAELSRLSLRLIAALEDES